MLLFFLSLSHFQVFAFKLFILFYFINLLFFFIVNFLISLFFPIFSPIVFFHFFFTFPILVSNQDSFVILFLFDLTIKHLVGYFIWLNFEMLDAKYVARLPEAATGFSAIFQFSKWVWMNGLILDFIEIKVDYLNHMDDMISLS